jgi:hypothetical protein
VTDDDDSTRSVDSDDSTQSDDVKGDRTISRRGMLRTVTAAAVGAISAAALGSSGASAAKPPTPSPLLLGHSADTHNTNLSSNATEVRYTGTSAQGIVFLAQDGTYKPANADFPAALGGWAGKYKPHGVFGFTQHHNGFGVVGESYYVGGYFTGGQAAISLAPQGTGKPTYPGQVGDLVVDNSKSHYLWLCKGGTRWVKVA